MKINRTEFKAILEKVKPGLASKEIIEQTSSFAFVDGRVLTFNDEISISHPIDLDITGVVKSTELYSLLTKVKKEDLTIEVQENQMIVSAGKTKAGIVFQAEIQLPLDELTGLEFDWKPLPAPVLDAIAFVQECCSTNAAQPILTAVHLTKKAVVASDGFRLAEWKVKCPVDLVLIPKSSILEVLKFKPSFISTNTGWCHFKHENGAILSCRVIEGKFPNCDSVWINEGDELTFPDTVKEALERVEIFAKKDFSMDESIEVLCVGNRLTLRAESDNGWIKEKLSLSGNEKEFSFNITPVLFRSILKHAKTCIVQGNSKIQFSTDQWRYLALLRAKQSK